MIATDNTSKQEISDLNQAKETEAHPLDALYSRSEDEPKIPFKHDEDSGIAGQLRVFAEVTAELQRQETERQK